MSSNTRDDAVVLDEAEQAFFDKPVADEEPLTDARGAAAREAIARAFVAERRARFARYVKAATFAAAVLCMAAFTLR